MRLGLTTALVALIAGSWLACSSFDDAPGAIDASAPDATTDGFAAADADADAAGPCTALFCDGFERTTGVDVGWNGTLQASFAELSLSKLHARSGSGSLQLKLLASAGETADRAITLVKELPLTATLAVLDFWLYYDSRPATDTTVAIIELRTRDGNVFVLLGTDGVFRMFEQYIEDGGTDFVTTGDVAVGVVGDGQPRHLKLEIGATLVANAPAARLTVDGEMRSLMLVNQDPRPEKVHIGSTYSAGGPGRREELFYYDDVVIEATPR